MTLKSKTVQLKKKKSKGREIRRSVERGEEKGRKRMSEGMP